MSTGAGKPHAIPAPVLCASREGGPASIRSDDASGQRGEPQPAPLEAHASSASSSSFRARVPDASDRMPARTPRPV
jgi:hypothetical protein